MIAGLPYDAEVEYLESTGVQFLDLCVYGNINSVAKIRACATAYDGINPLFGARTSFNSNGFTIYNGSDVGYKYTVSFDNVFSNISDVVSDVSSDVSDWVDFTLGLHTKIGTWEKDYTSRAQTFTTRNYLLLFAWNSAGSVYRGKYRVSEFRLYDGGVLIQDFIPVRFTNEFGVSEGAMYDRVSRKLFRNAGTGSFTIGPDVATPVMGLHFMRRPKYTARDYVQTGLIAMWDGEWNAGWGVHDAKATVWKDLVGNCHLDDLFVDSAYSPTSGFGDDYWWFTGGMSRWRKQNATITYKTAELVSFQPNEQYTSFCGGSGNYNLGGYFRSVVMGSSSSPYPSISRNTDSVSVYSYTIGTEGDSSTYTAYRDGSLISKGVVGAGNDYVADEVAIGTVVRRQLFVTPRIYCVRLYSRALTDDEIAHNYAVDKERFNLP